MANMKGSSNRLPDGCQGKEKNRTLFCSYHIATNESADNLAAMFLGVGVWNISMDLILYQTLFQNCQDCICVRGL